MLLESFKKNILKNELMLPIDRPIYKMSICTCSMPATILYFHTVVGRCYHNKESSISVDMKL